ncbi:MAG TPA: threonine-phosphate decarboxylase CobD [Dissulfurispiraceae bacterium]|nr:threonine-phosphate decarboxylase CobD [Dissulfurispiraceae bacterium]
MVGHGGDVYAASRELGIPLDRIIDFSASINPLGTPRSVQDELRRNLGRLRHYPDISSTELTGEVSKSIGVSPESIICGNGSTELIYLVVRALQPKRVLVTAPAFSEYENAVHVLSGSRIRRFTMLEKDNFKLDVDAFIKAAKGCDMAFICNPNNPTGGLVSASNMLRIAQAAEESGCCLVVDEAFIDFVPDESVIRKVSEYPSLIVIRSMTKFYALSGLRLGYAVINPARLDLVRSHKEPWTVNSLAQAAGVVALRDDDYKKRTFTFLAKEKEFLEKGFRRLDIQYVPSRANFYLLKAAGTAYNISVRLREKGILVRDCSNFMGLDGSYIRAAVRTRRENSRLLRELTVL